MIGKPVDDFAPPSSLEEAIIRRIKGDYRKVFITKTIQQDGLDSIPSLWTGHSLQEMFKGMLTSQNPRNRGGEDLPDLADGEVEIVRVSLADSVHGEVTSLRAQRTSDAILLRLVDEYETEFELPLSEIAQPFSAAELIEFLLGCSPCPLESSCQLRIASPFYKGLQQLLDDHLDGAAE